MILRAITILLVMGVAVSACAQEADIPVGLCARVAEPPVVDGVLDDAAWRQCQGLTPFALLDGTGPAKEQTIARVCCDGAVLFVGCELLDSEMAALAADETPYDDGSLFRNDCVEIFIQPDPEAGEYFHLVVSAAGSQYDAIATGGPIDWTPEWQVGVSKAEDRWFLEASIPLSQVGLAGVRGGDAIRFNVCREEVAHQELSCWSCTRGSFHNTALFGELVFYSLAAMVEARMAQIDEKAAAAREVSGDTPAFARAIAKLAAAQATAAKEDLGSEDWRALRPALAGLSKELDRLALGAREALIWQVNPWRLPAHTELPSLGATDVGEVTVQLMRGEYETLAFAIANLSEASLAYHVTATDLLRWHENEEISAEGRITLREAVSMRTRAGGMVRDALPLLDQAQRMVVPPAENAVLWVTLHADGLSPGSYLAGIDLLPLVGQQRRDVRLRILVYPPEMTKSGPPHVCNWAYLTRSADLGWAGEAAQDLAAHGVDVCLIQHGDIPWPSVDQAGDLAEPLDFARMDERIELLAENSFYLLALALHWFENLKTDLEPWTPEHKNALRQWSLAIRDHLAGKGIGRDRWAWYPIDEPSSDKTAPLVRNFADTVHEADAEMMVYANPFNRTTPEQIRVMGESIDIWAPNLSGLRDDDLAYMKQHGKLLWSYLVLGRLSSPYGAYRLPFWRVYDKGMTGFGHWAYDSVDGDVWDDADGRVSDYATCYEGPDGPIPSVRLEALREGAEDYRYLALVRDGAREAREAGEEDLARRTEATLNEALATTLEEAGNSEVANQQRLRLLDALTEAMAGLNRVDEDAITAFSRPVPVCLTGNGGPRVSNPDTGGYYTYSTFPTHTWNEQCELTEGKVWMRGENATEGRQAENKVGGDLTDGSWFYRQQFVNLWIWAPNAIEMTFDLMRPYRLARVDVFGGSQTGETNRVESLAVLVSETGEEGSFRQVGHIEHCPTAETGAQGELQILTGETARYVRIVATKKVQAMTIGEVRIWGYQIEG